jgi:hypothetical protein
VQSPASEAAWRMPVQQLSTAAGRAASMDLGSADSMCSSGPWCTAAVCTGSTATLCIKHCFLTLKRVVHPPPPPQFLADMIITRCMRLLFMYSALLPFSQLQSVTYSNKQNMYKIRLEVGVRDNQKALVEQ